MITRLILTLTLGCSVIGVARAQTDDRPLLVILTDAGEERDGLPVYTVNAAADSTVAGLSRGLSGSFLRIYWMEQNYLEAKDSIPPEPAYVLLSDRQGGYARNSFILDNLQKPEAGYVDVHRDWPVTGKFGALDQIVPHELAHVIRRQLAGELREGGANQVHALGLRTDRIVAFNEGFAEHLQAVAFDRSPDVPALVALAADESRLADVNRHLDAYRRELEARLAFAPRMRLGFIAWYSNDEDVLRYHGIRDNSFAREPALPDRLLKQDPYRAYLLEGVLPGSSNAPPKSLARMAASEGVVAAFFYRWAMHKSIGARRLDPEFYVPFGVAPDEVTDLENAYLKMIEVLYEAKPQTVFEMIDGYVERYPEEKAWIDSVATSVFLGPVGAPPPEIWMANRDFQTGTTLFDQFRGLPRTHSFDLNAASIVDLVAIKGVTPDLARKILASSPFGTVDEVRRVDGVSDELADRFEYMHHDMEVLRNELASETEESISINAILTPMIVRGLIVVALSSVLGLMLYAWLRRQYDLQPLRWFRMTWNGFLVGVLGCAGGWGLGLSGLGAIAVVAACCGLPAGIYQFVNRRLRTGLILFGAWVLAALPAAFFTGAWF